MQEFKTNYQMVSSKMIFSEPLYQRPVDFTRVKKIVANFNPNLVNPVKVSYRDGKYWVFDGQHTLKALLEMNNRRETMIRCEVFYGLTLQDEAKLFAEQNGIAKSVDSAQKLMSLYVAGDIDVTSFKETVESCGIICNFKKGVPAERKIICYSSLFKIYMKFGKKHLVDLLNIILDIWDGEGDSLRAEVINGVNLFIVKYVSRYNRKRLVSKLSKVSPNTIIRDGKMISTGGNNRYARVVLQIYNHGATHVTRLDDEF